MMRKVSLALIPTIVIAVVLGFTSIGIANDGLGVGQNRMVISLWSRILC